MPSIFKTLLVALLACATNAFVVTPAGTTKTMSRSMISLEAHKQKNGGGGLSPQLSAALFTTMVTIGQPLIALAEETDYEYGAVDAPIGLAVGGGILAIATALLPLALKGGEEAFEEMKERDDFGNSGDALNRRR